MTNTEIYRKAQWKINQELGGFYIPRLMIDREVLDDCEIYYNIFSHDFFKAFFGEELVQGLETNPNTEELILVPAWQVHLQLMILEKDPLKYLEKFL